MAKPKKVIAERLEDILFACRNHLRGKADQSDKRDALLTLVFLKFMSERYEDQAAKIAAATKIYHDWQDANGPASVGPAPRAGRCETAGGAAVSNTLTDGAGDGKSGAVDRSAGQHLFEIEWHDWVVSRDGQLAAFTRYIRENAERRWLRLSHPEYFRRVNEIAFLGRKWYGYGNAALLKLPILEPFRCSRKWTEGGEEWNAALARASRLGPGGAGVSTFMSPCEKVCFAIPLAFSRTRRRRGANASWASIRS